MWVAQLMHVSPGPFQWKCKNESFLKVSKEGGMGAYERPIKFRFFSPYLNKEV